MDLRFWAKVEKTDGCWNWIGAQTGGGYGHLARSGRYLMAHRYSYEQLIGPIPEDLDLDHLCRNRSCVNPDHLEPVTRRENLRRGIGGLPFPNGGTLNRAKLSCPRGHPYDEANTYWTKGGTRVCRECRQASVRRWQVAQPKRGPAPGARTHCPQGHPYDEANTIRLKSGARRCRQCQAEQRRESRRRRNDHTS